MVVISLKLVSRELISNNERFSPCDKIRGTNNKIKQMMSKRKKSKVVITAKVFPNFNLFFRNWTKGLAINEKTTDMIK